MNVSETKAGTKWCPFVRLVGSNGSSYSRMPDGTISSSMLCIGAQCMAWRWRRVGDTLAQDFDSNGDPTGFCGLAGEP